MFNKRALPHLSGTRDNDHLPFEQPVANGFLQSSFYNIYLFHVGNIILISYFGQLEGTKSIKWR